MIYKVKNDGTGFSIIYDFGGTNFPSRGALIVGSDGALYGTVILPNGADGGIYRIDTDGGGLQMYALPVAAETMSGVIEASDGRLYGTTSAGGGNEGGTLFGINKDGSGFALVHEFAAFSPFDGFQPAAEPLESSDGGLYVATRFGGLENAGTVCRINKNGSGFSILHHFPATGTNDGRIPNSRLAEGQGGYLYGTTEAGGMFGDDDLFTGVGVVYQVKSDGDEYSVVRRFEGGINDGIRPRNVLVGTDGNLYGTSQNAGYAANVDGIFRMGTAGSSFSLIYTWVAADNQTVQLNGIFQSTDGNIYGTSAAGGSSGVGQAFKVRPNGTQFQSLHEFSSTGADGSYPTTLLRDSDATLYGATLSGGATDSGTIYRLQPDGSYSILHEFVAPSGIPQGLTAASDGFLYGSSYRLREIFRLSKDGSDYTVLTTLSGAPVGSLIEGTDFLLYGVTEDGGAGSGGSIFRLNVDGTDVQEVHSFTNNAGSPVGPAGIVEASDGKLYGTSLRGGANDQGMVFRLNKDGSQYQVLFSFVAPLGMLVSPNPLMEATDGYLYGATRLGGGNGQGSIYRMSKGGSNEFLHAFTSDRGRPVGQLVEGPGGWLYGVTEDSGDFEGGHLFRFRLGSVSTVHVLYHFGNGISGRNPGGGLVVNSSNEIVGTTREGGFSSGFGTIFKVELRPVLGIRSVGDNFELSWPWNGENYNLQTTPNLAGPWSNPGVSSTNVGERVIATVPPGLGAGFYRLEKAQVQPAAGQ